MNPIDFGGQMPKVKVTIYMLHVTMYTLVSGVHECNKVI